ncbi:MAG: hypothetical protein WC011_03420 [Candidatus Paceibacterota bacterium]
MKENMGFNQELANIIEKQALEQKGFIGGDEIDKKHTPGEIELTDEDFEESLEKDYTQVIAEWYDWAKASSFDPMNQTPLEFIKSAKEEIENYKLDLVNKRKEVDSLSLEEQGKAFEEISDKIKKENEKISIAENFLMLNGKYFKKD